MQTSSFTIEQLIRFGTAHHQAGRLSDAEALYRQVLARSPEHPDALGLLGVAAIQTGRLQVAADYLRRAIARAPNVARYHCNLGECLRLLGDFQGAIVALRTAIWLKADLAVAHNNLGIALAESDPAHLNEAIAAYRTAIALQPNYPEALSNLGNALREAGQLDEAVAVSRQAVNMNPNRAENWNSLGVTLFAQGNLAEARPAYERAIELKPGYVIAHTNLGNAFAAEGREQEAAASLRRAVELSPDSPAAHWNLAVCLLRQGDFADGWKEHEWRLGARSQFPVRPFPQPQWHGEDLAGKTILLHAEQGFGDTIQFVRYVPLVAARGGRIILECQGELFGLFEGKLGIDRLIARGEPLPTFDFHCSLLSLPLAFNTTLGTIPADIPYLKADPNRVKKWTEKIAPAPNRLNVGLCWAGSPTHSNDASRSINVASLSVLASDTITLYGLQRPATGQNAPRLPVDSPIQDLGGQLTDFDDTAAAIANLDLVISVDTAVAHLAGALGKPVWLLLPLPADWRWLLNRADTPWYPTMRLFRQAKAGDWGEVLHRVAEALSAFSRTRATPG